jgi:hypothetical protein
VLDFLEIYVTFDEPMREYLRRCRDKWLNNLNRKRERSFRTYVAGVGDNAETVKVRYSFIQNGIEVSSAPVPARYGVAVSIRLENSKKC